MPDKLTARFGFCRLVVNDLQKEAAFYRSAIGYGEGLTIVGEVNGRPIEEIIFMEGGKAELVLLTYTDGGPATSPSGVMPAMFSPDLDAMEERVVAAGGSVYQAIGPMEMPNGPTRLAFFADPEGFVLEVIEQK